jgi:hypothetical protein
MRRISSLEELAELVDQLGEPSYVRYSAGPEADERETSTDHESGLELPGLSVNPLNPEEWWTRPERDWLARQLCQYAHLREEGEGERYAWVLTGQVAGHGPDCEPLIAGARPVARIADEAIDEAGRVYSERFDRQ